MAIIKNMWLKKASKRLGGAVLYQAMEQTRIRELASEVSNPRTTEQMQQRVKWANLVNFYRANRGWMKYAFSTKSANQSEYNKFMSLNVPLSNIYLTKQAAANGACIVAPYIITQGNIPSIEVNATTGGWLTNFFFSDGFTISSSTTIKQFSEAALAENPALQVGDQLSFIRFTQQTNPSSGVPYVIVRRYEVLLSTTDTRLFGEFFPLDYIGTGTMGDNVCLRVIDSGNAGGFVLIMSRTSGGTTDVSSQNIIVANNDATIAAYSSADALQAAISSYGESSEAFLSSTSADPNNQAAGYLSILTLTKSSYTYTTNDRVVVANWVSNTPIILTFSNVVTGSVTAGTMATNKALYQADTVAITDGKVYFNLPSPFEPTEDEVLDYIIVNLNGTQYRAKFQMLPGDAGGTGTITPA